MESFEYIIFFHGCVILSFGDDLEKVPRMN